MASVESTYRFESVARARWGGRDRSIREEEQRPAQERERAVCEESAREMVGRKRYGEREEQTMSRNRFWGDHRRMLASPPQGRDGGPCRDSVHAGALGDVVVHSRSYRDVDWRART